MVNVVIATHGTLARSFLETAEMLVGDQERVTTLGLCLGDSIDAFREQVASAIGEAAAGGDEVLVLTDMLSGSPFNCVCAASERYEFEHLTGVNLPLLLEIFAAREDSDARQLVKTAIEQAPETVFDAKRYFEEVI